MKITGLFVPAGAPPSVQLLKAKPGAGIAVSVTGVPLPTTPAPVTLPLADGATVAVMVRVVATKLAVSAV